MFQRAGSGEREIGNTPPPPHNKATRLVELRDFALVKGEVTLSSGATAQYLVDAKRVVMRPDGFRLIGNLVSSRRRSGALQRLAVSRSAPTPLRTQHLLPGLT